MESIIFEKKGALRLSRQIVLKSNEVIVYYCQKGFLEVEVKKPFKTNLQARRRFETVAESFRDAGFDEYNNPEEGYIGTISYIENPQGSSRIRVDIVGDVYFEPKNYLAGTFKQGDRVLVSGIKKKSKSKLEFMFESPWVATDVVLLLKKKQHSRKELPVAVRKKIIKQAGDSLKGSHLHQESNISFKIGQFVYGYHSGIYRIIKINGSMTVCEEVYSRKLLRASGAISQWQIAFCRPLSSETAKILKMAGAL